MLYQSKSNRGFSKLEFKDRYDSICSIQKSSLATEDAIWFGVEDANPLIMAADAKSVGLETDETVGWIKFPIDDKVLLHTRMHLTVDQVKELIPVLQHFVDTGEVSDI